MADSVSMVDQVVTAEPTVTVDPAVALLVFAGIVVLAVILAYLVLRILPRLRHRLWGPERVLVEDALKQLLVEERRGRAGCTLEALARAMEVSRSRARDLLGRLAASGMVRADGGEPPASGAGPPPPEYRLTGEGRRAAVRVVRAHRLWERYLADRTGVDAAEWHGRAERVEHLLDPERTDALAARLGHPRYDPHGDPIPTSGGGLPPFRDRTLDAVPPGETVRVVHLEDEPETVFEELLAAGLALGQAVEVLGTRREGVVLGVEGRKVTLPPVAAANVTVEPLPGGEPRPAPGEPRATLAEVDVGRAVRVTGIRPGCRGPQRRRLLDLGVVPGTVVAAEMGAWRDDPVAYRIRGALVALRRDQARWIEVEPVARPESAGASMAERAG